MDVESAGRLAVEKIAAHQQWECFAEFSQATYWSALTDPAEVIVVVADGVPSGPLHVRLREGGLGVRSCAPAPGAASVLAQRRTFIANAAMPWSGTTTPGPYHEHVIADLLCITENHLTDPLLSADDLAAAGRLLARNDMVGAAKLLIGKGSGLTPTGDDIMAGVLLVNAINGTAPDGALKGLDATTNAIASAYMRSAVRGQSIAPAHALLEALSAGDREGGRRSLRALSAYGATSGHALAWGLLHAAQSKTRS